MTPDDLHEWFRSQIDDVVTPYLWSEDEVYAYMDSAQKAFARQTDYFVDSTTYSGLTVTAGNPSVVLSDLILKIRKARLVNAKTYVEPVKLYDIGTRNMPDDYRNLFSSSNWEDLTGVPRCVITDMNVGTGRLVPIPVANDTLSLSVVRLPLTDLVPGAALFELADTEDQRMLFHWMAFKAYSKQDVDTYDPNTADNHRGIFTAYTDKRSREFRRKRSPAATTTYGGL
jgi:hypothetical protein